MDIELKKCIMEDCANKVKRIRSIFCSISCMQRYRSILIQSKKPSKFCLFCKAEIKKIRGWDSKKYCNLSCASRGSYVQPPPRKCLSCQTEFLVDFEYRSKKFCSLKCSQNQPRLHNKSKYKDVVNEWKNGKITGGTKSGKISKFIRRYIFEKYSNACAECGWNKINLILNKSPLQIDHIDGNFQNNSEENLILLCPNCHALTPTFGALNRGKGRLSMKKINNYVVEEEQTEINQ